jgi:predicted lysophospholipase L1 biosynthesis ABC-type transport system permease subunit
VEFKAVDAAWPLYGAPLLAPDLTLAEALAERDGEFGAVAEQNLLDRLDLRAGDLLTVGEAAFRVRAVLVREPDRVGGGFGLGAAAARELAGLAASGLDRPGALCATPGPCAFPEARPGPTSGLRPAAWKPAWVRRASGCGSTTPTPPGGSVSRATWPCT